MFTYAYNNFFSVCSLIPTVFMLSLAIIFLLVPRKSKATWHLCIVFFLLTMFFLAYYFAAAFYHPHAAYHRWVTANTILFMVVHSILFLLNQPEPVYPKFFRYLCRILYAGAIASAVAFITLSYKAPKVYHFSGHYWDFQVDELSKIVGLAFIAYMVILLATGIWAAYANKTGERWSILSMAIMFFASVMVPGITNVLSRDGLLDRGTYQITQDLSTIIGFFAVAIIYINTTRDRSSFMNKIVAISVATILVVFQGVSYFSLQDLDRAYDALCRKEISLALASGNIPESIGYMVEYSQKKGDLRVLHRGGDIAGKGDFGAATEEYFNTMMFERIKTLPSKNFRQGLKSLLDDSPHHFQGYRRLIESTAASLAVNEKNPARYVLGIIESIRRNNAYASKKIAEIPLLNFRRILTDFVLRENKISEPFRISVLETSKLKGFDEEGLKNAILKHFTPMNPAGMRFYRTMEGEVRHFVSYMHVDVRKNILYEAGFSYIRYRDYMHPTSTKFIIMLAGIMVIILVGFQLFFQRAFITPLKSLLKAMNQVKAGNLNVDISVRVEDELGFITRNFNEMVRTISSAKRKLDDYAQNLEEKVEQRTHDLKAAMDALEVTNNKLVQTRDALWGEMKLAKKIQTVLLPEKPEITGYNIAAVMKTADEVGGDYYDIINAGGRDWIVIGDVSGHGVPAGLVMMMVQTSILTALNDNPDLKPSKLLELINRTITKNISRMKEDKFMTITVLAYFKEGGFYHAGRHEDILLYRVEKSHVELIKTDGMWLGLTNEIGPMLKDKSLTMDKGDVMLLYTDGITEAKIKSPAPDSGGQNREMFGKRKLAEKFGRLCKQKLSSQDVINGILESLEGYEFTDDVTLVVLKRSL